MADVFAVRPHDLERALAAAGLRANRSVTVEPSLNALGPELGITAVDAIPAYSAAFLGFVELGHETVVEVFVQASDNSLYGVSKLMKEDVLTLPGISIEAEQILFTATGGPATHAATAEGPPP